LRVGGFGNERDERSITTFGQTIMGMEILDCLDKILLNEMPKVLDETETYLIRFRAFVTPTLPYNFLDF